MPKPWTSHLIRDALGVKKCNGSMEAATEDLPLEKAMEVAKKKHGEGHLTGADLKAQTREVIGTCVSCLLYTSPSPRDMRRSRMPSSA